MLQTSVEIVNPGGTGSPALVISASPDPLPPSRSFMFRLPSALPLPKKYTYCLRDFAAWGLGLGACFFAAAFFAIVTPIQQRGNRGGRRDRKETLFPVGRAKSQPSDTSRLRCQHRYIANVPNVVAYFRQQRQSR